MSGRVSARNVGFDDSLSYQTFLLELVTAFAFESYDLVVSFKQTVDSGGFASCLLLVQPPY
jgi:hypothetical protein